MARLSRRRIVMPQNRYGATVLILVGLTYASRRYCLPQRLFRGQTNLAPKFILRLYFEGLPVFVGFLPSFFLTSLL